MMERAVLPGPAEAVRPRRDPQPDLKTWGYSESGLAELVAGRVEALEPGTGVRRLPSWPAHEGIKLRLTVKAADDDTETRRSTPRKPSWSLARAVFGVDGGDDGRRRRPTALERGWSLGVAESLTVASSRHGSWGARRERVVPGSSGGLRRRRQAIGARVATGRS